MDEVKKLNKWANAHTYYGIDILRIAVGIFLVWKGISFFTNVEYYNFYADALKKFGGGMIIIHYVVAANFVGGIMLIFGLLTRWAIFAQLPILFGAFLINFTGTMIVQNLIFSILLFGICIFFLLYGSGKHSADYYFKMNS